jgi:hypothetical protein
LKETMHMINHRKIHTVKRDGVPYLL